MAIWLDGATNGHGITIPYLGGKSRRPYTIYVKVYQHTAVASSDRLWQRDGGDDADKVPGIYYAVEQYAIQVQDSATTYGRDNTFQPISLANYIHHTVIQYDVDTVDDLGRCFSWGWSEADNTAMGRTQAVKSVGTGTGAPTDIGNAPFVIGNRSDGLRSSNFAIEAVAIWYRRLTLEEIYALFGAKPEGEDGNLGLRRMWAHPKDFSCDYYAEFDGIGGDVHVGVINVSEDATTANEPAYYRRHKTESPVTPLIERMVLASAASSGPAPPAVSVTLSG